MEILYYMIPVAIAMGCFFVALFIWATKDGQFDDLETPAHRILIEDEINTDRRRSSHVK